ncbi:YezD family protein [Pectinatus frisingensis]|uniref:YezD family protein n=1 Tax=Pectinatus frisingensis TaxID=865 RepID=UPI0018C5E7AC|nr:YezD family protein [Pectinatus frisingensis]
MTDIKTLAKHPKIDSAAMKLIVTLLKAVFHGEITLIVQNSCLIQVERNEKIRLSDIKKFQTYTQKSAIINYDPVCQKIQQEFYNLEYGNIVIIIKAGRVVQVERTEKYRFQGFTGMDGEGI